MGASEKQQQIPLLAVCEAKNGGMERFRGSGSEVTLSVPLSAAPSLLHSNPASQRLVNAEANKSKATPVPVLSSLVLKECWSWHVCGSGLKKIQLQGHKEHVGAPAAKCLRAIKQNAHLGLGGCEVLQVISEHSCRWSEDSTFWDGFGACGAEPVWWHKWLCCFGDTDAVQSQLCTLSCWVHDPKDVFL